MCGIVGYVGKSQASGLLLDGLARLEYRGYDSAGIATLSASPLRTHTRRSVGAVDALRAVVQQAPPPGTIGLAHTRWATHGAPRVENAHPHHVGTVTVVHNGIIENATELRRQVEENDGRPFRSDTDTEVIAHMLSMCREMGMGILQALQTTMPLLHGSFAMGIIDEGDPDTIFFARRGSPLVLGIGTDGVFLASDGPAMGSAVQRIVHLEEGDHGAIHRSGAITVFDEQLRPVTRTPKAAAAADEVVTRGGYRHFMRKEIGEQGQVIDDTVAAAITADGGDVTLRGLRLDACPRIDRVLLLGCGSSFHAASIGARFIEDCADIATEVHLASEWRYGRARVDEHTLVIGISQSGETADTLAALEEAKRRGAHIGSICNVVGSAIDRACRDDAGSFHTRAGIELGVASTKAFTAQVVALHALSLALARRTNLMTAEDAVQALRSHAIVSGALRDLEKGEGVIRAIAEGIIDARSMLYLGRGAFAAVAAEGALKMAEISYVHAQGFAAGEMKHGPIALIEKGTPVVVIAPRDALQPKVLSNLAEVKARGAFVIAIGEAGDTALANVADVVITVPPAPTATMAVLATLPLQLLAYHLADLRGLNVDRPRNLAKSVTVE